MQGMWTSGPVLNECMISSWIQNLEKINGTFFVGWGQNIIIQNDCCFSSRIFVLNETSDTAKPYNKSHVNSVLNLEAAE